MLFLGSSQVVLVWVIPNIINYTEPIIVCDLHIKLSSTYLCVCREIVCEKCTPKSCVNFGIDGAISTAKINRKVYGENGCANVAKVEATDVIWKRVGDNPILPVMITLSSTRISCPYSLPKSPKHSANGIQWHIEEVA